MMGRLKLGECSTMAVLQLPKLATGVRFPSLAPNFVSPQLSAVNSCTVVTRSPRRGRRSDLII